MKSNPTTDQMKRGEFLRSLGLSSAALMAFYCMGTTMTACSKAAAPSRHRQVPALERQLQLRAVA